LSLGSFCAKLKAEKDLGGTQMNKTVLALCLLTVLFVAPSLARLEAAPPQQRAAITSPQDRDVVRGLLVIKGTATHPNFWKYEVHYAPEPNPTDQWQLMGLHEVQVTDGRLETWDTSLVPDGTYSLRLRVVRADGNYDEYYVRQISVVNAQPTETPTTTPTPPATRTPLPPTPTVIIEQPPTSTPRPTSTPAPAGVTPEAEAETGLNITAQGLGKALLYGAGGAMGLFLLMAIIIIMRRLISWLIAQF
jgi:hypothetical protein